MTLMWLPNPEEDKPFTLCWLCTSDSQCVINSCWKVNMLVQLGEQNSQICMVEISSCDKEAGWMCFLLLSEFVSCLAHGRDVNTEK